MKAFLSLGSNLGDRLGNLAGAIRALREGGTRRVTSGELSMSVTQVSPVYESAPLGASGEVVTDQPPFLNCVVEIDTPLTAAALHDRTKAVERRLGRENRERWQPRTIDIDIVLYGDDRITLPALTIPHPRMHERAFVVLPLLDLDPGADIPGLGRLSRFVNDVAGQDCRLHTAANELGRRSM